MKNTSSAIILYLLKILSEAAWVNTQISLVVLVPVASCKWRELQRANMTFRRPFCDKASLNGQSTSNEAQWWYWISCSVAYSYVFIDLFKRKNFDSCWSLPIWTTTWLPFYIQNWLTRIYLRSWDTICLCLEYYKWHVKTMSFKL